MQIYDDLQIVLCCPFNRFVQIRRLALNKGLPSRDIICPVAYWNTDVIEPRNLVNDQNYDRKKRDLPSGCNFNEVLFRNKGVPVSL